MPCAESASSGWRCFTLRGILARPSLECGGRPSPFRDPRDAPRFGERSRRRGCPFSGVASSLLLFPLGSSGGVAATTGAEGEERRARTCGTRPGDLVRRPIPFPRCSHLSFSSLDDDDDNGLFADEGRGIFVLSARSCLAHGAAGMLPAASPPTRVFPSGLSVFPPMIDAFVESSVRVGFVVGEKVSVSPVHEAFPAMPCAITADNLWTYSRYV